MARPLRIEFPGGLYHVTARGNARQDIFVDGRDREAFLQLWGKTLAVHHGVCHSYCLMDNHYHLLVETPEGNLSRMMKGLNGPYTQRFNQRHGRAGHVFQGRFKSIVVDKENYLLQLCRYIDLNPVRAGLADDPGAYPWSSFQAITGMANRPEWLAIEWVLAQFGNDPGRAREEYARFVRSGTGKESPLKEVKGQVLLGGAALVEKLLPQLKHKATAKEIPAGDRLLSRPPLNQLFAGLESRNKAERNRAIHVAYYGHAYRQKEIADLLGLHYTTVCNVLKQK